MRSPPLPTGLSFLLFDFPSPVFSLPWHSDRAQREIFRVSQDSLVLVCSFHMSMVLQSCLPPKRFDRVF